MQHYLGLEPHSRTVKVGETLASTYDLSCVDEEDKSSVLATITCVATLEVPCCLCEGLGHLSDNASRALCRYKWAKKNRMPVLDIIVRREAGYYAIVVRGFNEYINIDNWYERVRVQGGRSGMRLVRNFIANPSKGTLVVRVGMHAAGGTVPFKGGSTPSKHSGISGGRGKRARDDDDDNDDNDKSYQIDPDLANRIRKDLQQRCNLDAAAQADRQRLLTILYHVTLLDKARPLLDIRPVQLDTEGYVVTCTGFPNVIDFDEMREALRGEAAQLDEALRTLKDISYNVAEGVLQLVVEGPSLLSGGKRRRTAIVADDKDDDDE